MRRSGGTLTVTALWPTSSSGTLPSSSPFLVRDIRARAPLPTATGPATDRFAPPLRPAAPDDRLRAGRHVPFGRRPRRRVEGQNDDGGDDESGHRCRLQKLHDPSLIPVRTPASRQLDQRNEDEAEQVGDHQDTEELVAHVGSTTRDLDHGGDGEPDDGERTEDRRRHRRAAVTVARPGEHERHLAGRDRSDPEASGQGFARLQEVAAEAQPDRRAERHEPEGDGQVADRRQVLLALDQANAASDHGTAECRRDDDREQPRDGLGRPVMRRTPSTSTNPQIAPATAMTIPSNASRRQPAASIAPIPTASPCPRASPQPARVSSTAAGVVTAGTARVATARPLHHAAALVAGRAELHALHPRRADRGGFGERRDGGLRAAVAVAAGVAVGRAGGVGRDAEAELRGLRFLLAPGRPGS